MVKYEIKQYFRLRQMCNSSYYFWFLKLSVFLLSDELWNSLAEFTYELVYGTCTFSISPNDFHVVGWITNLFKHTTSTVRRKKNRTTLERQKDSMVIKTLCCTLLIYLQHNEQIQCLFEKKIHKGFHWTPQISRRYVVLIGLVSHNLFPSSESTVEPLLRVWVLTVKTEGLWFICLSCTGSFTLLLDFRNKHLKVFLLLGTVRIPQEVFRENSHHLLSAH